MADRLTHSKLKLTIFLLRLEERLDRQGENILTFSIYHSDRKPGKRVPRLRLTHKLLKGHVIQPFRSPSN